MTAGTDSSFGALVHRDWQHFLWQMTASVLCASLPSKNLVEEAVMIQGVTSELWGRQVLEAVQGEVECGQAAAWKQIPAGLAHCFNPLLSRSAEGDPEYSGGRQRVSINQFLFLMAGAGRGGQLEVTAGGCPLDGRDPSAGIHHMCIPQATKGQWGEAGSLSLAVPWHVFMNNALSLSLRKAGEITFPHPQGTGLWVFAYRFLFVSPHTDLRAGHTGLGGQGWDSGVLILAWHCPFGCVQCLCSHSVCTIELSYHHGCGALSHLPRMVRGYQVSAKDAGGLVGLVTAGVEGSVTAWHALLCALPLDTASSWPSVGIWEWMGWDCIAIRNLSLCHCRSYAERNLARSPVGHGLSNGGGRWG